MSIADFPLARKVTEPLSAMDEMILEENSERPVFIRHFYKITEYNNKKHGTIWACYTSTSNPVDGLTKSIDSCFILSKIKDELKIIAEFGPDYDTNKWRFFGGDDELKHYKLGKLIKTERLMIPVNNDWSIKVYNEN